MAKLKTSEAKNRPPLYWRKKYEFLGVFLIMLACGYVRARYQAGQVQPFQRQEALDCALIDAIWKDNRSDVADWLHRGANPNGHYIAIEPSSSDVNQIKNPLLRRFASFVEVRRYHRLIYGQTALHEALSKVKNTEWVPSNVAIVTLLVQAGADVNAADENGWVPLTYAASTKQCDLVELLLDHGARINNIDPKLDRSALDMAVMRGDVPTLTLLLHRGADVNLTDEYGSTALMKAAQWGNRKAVHILLSAGASANHRNKLGWDALTLASLYDQHAIVKILKQQRSLPARSALQRAKR